MSTIHVIYDPTTGEIAGHSTFEPVGIAGVAHVASDVADGAMPTSLTHRIDLKTLGLVEKHPDEQAAANLPKAHEVKHAIATALMNSDQFMMPDRSVANRAAWTTYRQALRDLSKLATPVDMVKAWPSRPDGAVEAADLKARIPT